MSLVATFPAENTRPRRLRTMGSASLSYSSLISPTSSSTTSSTVTSPAITAVFVDDNRELEALALELAEHIRHPFGLGDERGGAHDLGDLGTKWRRPSFG